LGIATMSVQTPNGSLPEEKVFELFDKVGFEPPAGMPLWKHLICSLA